jgi:hypothetical protein
MRTCPRPSALLRAGVGLSRASLRCGAAHSSLWSLPSYPSRIPDASKAAAATPPSAGAHLPSLPLPTRRFAHSSLRAAAPLSLRAAGLRSLRSASPHYRSPPPGPPVAFLPSRPAAFRSSSTLWRLRSIPPASGHSAPCRPLPTRQQQLPLPPKQPTHGRPRLPLVAQAAPPIRLAPRPASRWSASRFHQPPKLPQLLPAASPPHRCRTAQGPKMALTPPVRTPRFGRRPQAKKPATRPVVLRSGHAGQKQGPLRGGFHWGAPQPPATMPGLAARSSSSASAA